MEVSFIDLQFCIKVILQHKINQRWNPLKYKCPYIRQPWYLKEFAIFLNVYGKINAFLSAFPFEADDTFALRGS